MRAVTGLAGAALLLAGPALAADLAIKAPVHKAPMPMFSWTGCYVGGHVGGAADRQDVFNSGSAVGDQAATSNTLNGSSLIGGAYAGCNWQFAPAWVLGVEGDFSQTKLNDSSNAPNLFLSGNPVGSGGISWSRDTDRLASVRGRLGYAVMPNFLLFGTGGIAWEHSDFAGLDAGRNGCPNCQGTAFGQTKDGFVAGGGIDWAPWNNNWIFRIEYLHYQFAGASSTVNYRGAPDNPITFKWGDLSVDTLRAGVSYKF